MSTTVAASIGVVLKLCHILGLVPKYNYKIKAFKVGRIHTYILIITFLITYTYSRAGKRKMEIFAGTVIKRVFTNLSLLVVTLSNIQTMISSTSWNLKHYQFLFDNFNLIDEHLFTVHNYVVPICKKVKLHFSILNLFIIIMTIFDFLYWDIKENKEQMKYIIHEIIQTYYMFVLIILQYYVLSFIKCRFRKINSIIEHLDVARMKLILNKGETRRWLYKIDNVTKLHNIICDMIDCFNQIFGWPIFFTMLYIIINVSSVIDIISTIKVELNIIEKLLMILWIFYLIGQGVLIAVMCESVTEEGRQLIKNSYAALNRYSYHQSIKEKLFILAQQTNARYPAFTAAGFFKVDYSILFTFLNLIATYAIVIIQFSHAAL